MTIAIEAHGLRHAFGPTRALDGVDLEVPVGTVLGMLRYVFGGAIQTGIGLAEDAGSGLVDRLRTLPIRVGAPPGEPWLALAWSVAIIAVAAPLAVRAHRRV